jgi:hypothetical protein
MIELRPVREPRRGHDRPLVILAVLVGLALAVVVLKPWQAAPSAPLALASPLPTASPAPTELAPGSYRNYSTALFGDRPHAPAYELWPAGYLVSFGFTRLVNYRPLPNAPAGIDVAGALPIGTVSTTSAVGINHPAEVTIQAIHLWYFGAGGGAPPSREAIVTLPSPFDLQTFDVIGIPSATQADLLANWQAGLYRLDLLFGATSPGLLAPRVVSLSLRVSADPTPGSSPSARASAVPPGTFAPGPVQDAPPGALVALGEAGLTVHRIGGLADGQPECSAGQIWAAEGQPGQPCQAWRVGAAQALGYVARAGETVRAVSLTALDPVPGPVGRPDLTIRHGLAAVVSADGRDLAEGLYRLEITLGDGTTRRWFIEIHASPGPDASSRSGA